VRLRGNGRQDIFSDNEDRYHLYLRIQQGVERYRHRVHGFCCMTNPIHLAIQVAEDPLSGRGKKRVIDRSFIREEKMDGCWRIIDFRKIDAKAKNSDKLRDKLNG
jgi:REP element-mobilizing transposase RayT